MPVVAAARDLERVQREQPGSADGTLKVATLDEPSAQVIIDGHVEASLTCQEHALRADRQFELELEKAEHVGDDRPGEPRLQLRQVAP